MQGVAKCRIAGGAYRSSQVEVIWPGPHAAGEWLVGTRATWDEVMPNLGRRVDVEFALADGTVWTGQAFLTSANAADVPVSEEQQRFPVQVNLAGAGPLSRAS